MNILLIGNGAREHVIAETIARSPKNPKLFAYMDKFNPGIAELCEDTQIGKLDDVEAIKAFAQAINATYAVVGPEAPLDAGVVDALEEVKISSFGPNQELAQLETSKSFTRLLMKKYNIPGNPKFFVSDNIDEIREFVKGLDEFVVKPDGLTGGKGVKVQGDHFSTKEEGVAYAEEVLRTHPTVVIEEKLDGEEFSLQCITDGKTVIASPVCQDHKRAYVNDEGPNTGGMGSYSDFNNSLPFLMTADVEKAVKITEEVAKALHEETGQYYKGVMYGGFIMTKHGVRLIEYNARFGDPEAMNILPLLLSDFTEIIKGVVEGTLDKVKVEWDRQASVCKYAVPEGYPSNPVKNAKIDLSEVPRSAKVYFAAVDKKEDGLYMSTSRAVAFVGVASDLEQAQVIAEDAVSSVKGPIFHRDDIGTKALIDKRVKHIEKLRKE